MQAVPCFVQEDSLRALKRIVLSAQLFMRLGFEPLVSRGFL